MKDSRFERPVNLTAAQAQAWQARCGRAEHLLALHPQAAAHPNELHCLRRYVAGHLTLAQAIAGLLDAQARR